MKERQKECMLFTPGWNEQELVDFENCIKQFDQITPETTLQLKLTNKHGIEIQTKREYGPDDSK